MASKLYGVNASIIIFVFVLYCIVLYCIVLYIIHKQIKLKLIMGCDYSGNESLETEDEEGLGDGCGNVQEHLCVFLHTHVA